MSVEPRRRGERLSWGILAAILAVTAAIRWRVLDAPLERDEGEYAYMGQLLLQGVPPYAEAYNMKLPGIYAAYAAVLAVFGETARGIHQGLLVVNALSIVLLFLLARRLAGPVAGLAAAAAFALLSLSVAVQGVFANAEHFVLPFALAGLLSTLAGLERGDGLRLALGGFLLGCGFVVKQHGIAFLGAGGLLVVGSALRGLPWRAAGPAAPRGVGRALGRVALFVAASLLPYGLTCLAMALAGVFPEFWLWTFRYARAYTSRISLAEGAPRLLEVAGHLWRTAPALWVVAAAGLASLAWDARSRRSWGPLLVLVLLSVLSVFPGFLFRPHYFQLALPAAGVCFGLGVAAAARLVQRGAGRPAGLAAALLLAAGALGQSVVRQYDMLFVHDPILVSMQTFGPPFHVSQAIAQRLREDTLPTDRIAVLGSEPQIYFYARRRAATGYLYTYPLMEPQPYAPRMLAEFQREIEAAEPAYLVWVSFLWSWLPTDEPWRRMVGWFERYRRGYELVARYDIGAPFVRVIEGPQLAIQPAPKYSIDLWRRVAPR